MTTTLAWSPDRYVLAYRFAAEAHRGQTVPGTDLPYLLHVGTVAMEVLGALQVERFENPDLAVQCALLHDILEDTETTYEQLASRFGAQVADGAQALSKNPTLPKPERMRDSLQRIRAQPREVWIVKLADRITNLQPPPAHWTREKRARYREEATAILDALEPSSAYLSARLRQKIADYARYTRT